MRNRILITRNPFKLGNAIVHSKKNGLYTIITDYGNISREWSYGELVTYYHVHRIADESHKHHSSHFKIQ